MRVAISALSVKPDNTGGGETVLRNLVRHLPLADPRIEYLIFVTPKNQALFAGDNPSTSLEVVPGWFTSPARRIFYEAVVLPGLLKRRGVDLFFAVNQVASPLLPCPFVAFVQNLLYYHYREFYRFSGFCFPTWVGMEIRNLYFSSMQGLSVRRAVHTVAVSEMARQEVAHREGIPLARISAIPLAASTDYAALHPNHQTGLKQILFAGIEPFFLIVGALSPYKNIDLAIAGLACLRQESATKDISLVVLGLDTHGYERHLCRTAAQLGIADAVHFPGYVPHTQLGTWYRQATALLLLSACEAFPLPPLEAMACGTPVIASNLSSVPEVVGEGGLLVNPYDPVQLTQAMHQVMVDDQLRTELIDRGYKWVNRFSWKQTAAEIAKLLHVCHDLEKKRSANSFGK